MTLPTRHRTLLALALPMILANVSQPILGLVDTAVLGHLGDAQFLAGTAVGAFLIAQIFWLCGFMRQSMTGLSAQQKGAREAAKASQGEWDDLARGLLFAFAVGILLAICHPPLLQLMQHITDLPTLAQSSLSEYFVIRIWNAPIALANLVVIGYLVGQQQTRSVMVIQVGINVLNIILNIVFVFGFDLGVNGVAIATVVAEWCMLLASLYCIANLHLKDNTARLSSDWFTLSAFRRLLGLNRDLFIRALMLQACLAFLTYQGARYGVEAAAVNAILMQFFVLIALGLDGIAYAIEAMIGEREGAKNRNGLWEDIGVSLIWSNIFGVAITLVMALGYPWFVSLLTNQPHVIVAAQPYYWIMVALPFLAHWCYCLDGIYIGLTRGDIMRNSMFISALFGFFGLYWLMQLLSLGAGNMALWIALLGLQVTRGTTLGGHLLSMYYPNQSNRLKRDANMPK